MRCGPPAPSAPGKLAPLDAGETPAPVRVVESEGGHLLTANASRIEQLQDRPVPNTPGGARIRGLEDAPGFLDAEHAAGRPVRQPWKRQSGAGIQQHGIDSLQVLEETAQRLDVHVPGVGAVAAPR